MWTKCALILQKWHPKSKLVLFGQVRGNLSKFGPVSFEKTAPNMQWNADVFCFLGGWGNLGKNRSHSQRFACSYTYAWDCQTRTKLCFSRLATRSESPFRSTHTFYACLILIAVGKMRLFCTSQRTVLHLYNAVHISATHHNSCRNFFSYRFKPRKNSLLLCLSSFCQWHDTALFLSRLIENVALCSWVDTTPSINHPCETSRVPCDLKLKKAINALLITGIRCCFVPAKILSPQIGTSVLQMFFHKSTHSNNVERWKTLAFLEAKTLHPLRKQSTGWHRKNGHHLNLKYFWNN